MKLLKAAVLVLALILAACEGAVSPTEPQLIETQDVRALPNDAGPDFLQPDDRPEGDEPE